VHHCIQATTQGKAKSWVRIRLHRNTTKARPALNPPQKEKYLRPQKQISVLSNTGLSQTVTGENTSRGKKT